MLTGLDRWVLSREMSQPPKKKQPQRLGQLVFQV